MFDSFFLILVEDIDWGLKKVKLMGERERDRTSEGDREMEIVTKKKREEASA